MWDQFYCLMDNKLLFQTTTDIWHSISVNTCYTKITQGLAFQYEMEHILGHFVSPRKVGIRLISFVLNDLTMFYSF